jgi:hypothetical protein
MLSASHDGCQTGARTKDARKLNCLAFFLSVLLVGCYFDHQQRIFAKDECSIPWDSILHVRRRFVFGRFAHYGTAPLRAHILTSKTHTEIHNSRP